MFIRACQWSLSWARYIQSLLCPDCFWIRPIDQFKPTEIKHKSLLYQQQNFLSDVPVMD